MEPEQRLKWDDGLAEYKVYPRYNQYIQVAHIVNKAPTSRVSNRDFIEKRVLFTEAEGTTYIYITFTPDTILPPAAGVERGRSIIGCFKLWKEASGVKMIAFQ